MTFKTLNYHALTHTPTVWYANKYYRQILRILIKGRSTLTSATAHQDITTAVFTQRLMSHRTPNGAEHQEEIVD